MKTDLAGSPDVREVVLLTTKGVALNWSTHHFRYYEDEHPHLRQHLMKLQDAGFVEETHRGNVPSYRLTEEFVQSVIGN